MLVLHHADGLVGQVLAQVIALLGPARRLDVVIVTDQVGGPVIGVALQEAVVALEPEAERPRVEGAGRRALPAGGEMPFADGHGRVARVAQQAGESGGRLGQSGVVAGKAQRDVGQEPHADGMVVAAREEGRSGGRAQRRDVEAVERRAVLGQGIEMGGPDVGAESPEVPETGVVEHDGDDVGGTLGRLRVVGESWGRLGWGETDLLGLVHTPRG